MLWILCINWNLQKLSHVISDPYLSCYYFSNESSRSHQCECIYSSTCLTSMCVQSDQPHQNAFILQQLSSSTLWPPQYARECSRQGKAHFCMKKIEYTLCLPMIRHGRLFSFSFLYTFDCWDAQLSMRLFLHQRPHFTLHWWSAR